MKTVRLSNSIVKEIVPEYALPVEAWYGSQFALQCVEAPDDVELGWVFDPSSGEFSAPTPPEPEPPAPTLDERVTSLETEKASQADVDELNEALDMILTGYTGEEAADETGA